MEWKEAPFIFICFGEHRNLTNVRGKETKLHAEIQSDTLWIAYLFHLQQTNKNRENALCSFWIMSLSCHARCKLTYKTCSPSMKQKWFPRFPVYCLMWRHERLELSRLKEKTGVSNGVRAVASSLCDKFELETNATLLTIYIRSAPVVTDTPASVRPLHPCRHQSGHFWIDVVLNQAFVSMSVTWSIRAKSNSRQACGLSILPICSPFNRCVVAIPTHCNLKISDRHLISEQNTCSNAMSGLSLVPYFSVHHWPPRYSHLMRVSIWYSVYILQVP